VTDLFAWSEGAELRDRGMAIAEAAQERDDPGARHRKLEDLRAIALRQPTVHFNDLYAVNTEKLSHPNAMGAIWREASHPSRGFLAMTDETRHCADPLKHAHRSPVYQSLIYEVP
jgi:hypothetical protein